MKLKLRVIRIDDNDLARAFVSLDGKFLATWDRPGFLFSWRLWWRPENDGAWFPWSNRTDTTAAGVFSALMHLQTGGRFCPSARDAEFPEVLNGV